MSDPLSRFVRQHSRLFVLSGAGVSTASGIPDYRDEQGQWKRNPPVHVRDFVGSAAARRRFRAPDCPRCGGMLNPDVVFFGDTVPPDRVAAAMEALEQADAMLVVGSSLMLRSGYRFCEGARHLGKPIAAINIGRTRADHLFQVKIERPCAEVLADLVRGLIVQCKSHWLGLRAPRFG